MKEFLSIYFGGSIRGGRRDVGIYADFINYLKQFGEVITEHVGDFSLETFGEIEFSDKEIHERDLERILSADICIFDVTNPSLGVGYEIREAENLRKPILCLYNPNKIPILSAMIGGSSARIEKYTSSESAKKVIKNFIEEFSTKDSFEKIDSDFTF